MHPYAALLALLAACAPEPNAPDPIDKPDRSGTADPNDTADTPEPTARIIGYLPTWRSLDPAATDLAALTHLCIAFAVPTGEGEAIDFVGASPADIRALVKAAHAADVQVLASLGGGADSATVAAKLAPATIDAFTAEVVALADRYDLDGIDVDIEGAAIDENYGLFVAKLRAALGSDRLLTAAVATWNGAAIPDEALAAFDLLLVMSYDHCGPWGAACDHATVPGARADLAYWVETRGYPADQTVLGVPFYGYCWGAACAAEALTYAEILANWPAAATTDWLAGEGYAISLNSAATIEEKVGIADDYGGVMAWELGQDAAGAGSLLSVIAGE